MRAKVRNKGKVGVKCRVADGLLESSEVRCFPPQEGNEPLSRMIAPESESTLVCAGLRRVS